MVRYAPRVASLSGKLSRHQTRASEEGQREPSALLWLLDTVGGGLGHSEEPFPDQTVSAAHLAGFGPTTPGGAQINTGVHSGPCSLKSPPQPVSGPAFHRPIQLTSLAAAPGMEAPDPHV